MKKTVDNQSKSTPKPDFLSDEAWVKLHKVVAKIHLNHLEEIREIQRRKKNNGDKS